MNQIQWLRFSPARSSSTTCAKTASCALTKRSRSKESSIALASCKAALQQPSAPCQAARKQPTGQRRTQSQRYPAGKLQGTHKVSGKMLLEDRQPTLPNLIESGQADPRQALMYQLDCAPADGPAGQQKNENGLHPRKGHGGGQRGLLPPPVHHRNHKARGGHQLFFRRQNVVDLHFDPRVFVLAANFSLAIHTAAFFRVS